MKKAIEKKGLAPFVKSGGFSVLEVLIALSIFSYALLAFSSISLSVISENKYSSNYNQAILQAQSTMAELRFRTFDMGPDTTIGTGDDEIHSMLLNCSTGNDASTDSATLFASPDNFYENTTGTSETLKTCAASPTINKYLQRTWTIKDNTPVAGMKTIIVVVGWTEKGDERYVQISSARMGD